MTAALEGGEWSAARPGRTLPQGKKDPVPILQEAGWAPGQVWTDGISRHYRDFLIDNTIQILYTSFTINFVLNTQTPCTSQFFTH